ncbi:hypothetical protein M758_2G033900 [Ceratodon purpureus]|uniref:4a-hydroxytetrahydrobiopterin dehydratase n=1 Tax=Ceratodon purpureus TaxID=3225 RepID=A0A8T0IPS6_CERPU|nr:hypothetical protein KC19_2G034800 [Ceratodon purpureus]KAG0625179.1 hypothetical protein M758_2G033900 [Ceratodon purpureus]
MAMAMAMAMSTTHGALLTLAHPHQALLSGLTSTSKPSVVALGAGRRRARGAGLVVRAGAGADDGGWGARDPYPAEIESNFGDRINGNVDTEHIIMVPTLAVLSLSEKTIKPLAEGAVPLTEAEAKALLRKVVGWRLVNQGSSDGAGLKLQCDWVLRDSDSVNELYSRIAKVAEATSYEHEIQTLENNKVRIEVWTPAIGGLSENDFIFASKLDQVETKDLTKRLRTWF